LKNDGKICHPEKHERTKIINKKVMEGVEEKSLVSLLKNP
jgi:hypothetical protein